MEAEAAEPRPSPMAAEVPAVGAVEAARAAGSGATAEVAAPKAEVAAPTVPAGGVPTVPAGAVPTVPEVAEAASLQSCPDP